MSPDRTAREARLMAETIASGLAREQHDAGNAHIATMVRASSRARLERWVERQHQ